MRWSDPGAKASVQHVWDTLIRSVGAPATALQSSTKLFGNANVGNLALTNLN